MQAYCVRCHTKREMKDARPIAMKSGKPVTEGTCPVCGTRIVKIEKGSS